MSTERERWVPMAQRLYDDDALTYQQPNGRNPWAGLSVRRQDKYIERAREYSGLLPEAVDPLVLRGFKSELNRVMDELETVREQRDEWRHGARTFSIENAELLGQLTRVRELLRDLPTNYADDVVEALDGPPRCRARSGGDSDARCQHPEGHARVDEHPRGQLLPSDWQYDHANEREGTWWNER